MNPPINLVVLISGNGSNLQAILDNIAAGKLAAKVAAVISDCADAHGLTRAKRAGVRTALVARDDYKTAAAFDAALLKMVASFSPDAIVLAGFMRILPPPFIARFANRIVNIHPSLLPKFKGLNTHQRAIDAGAHRHGATVHIVTDKLDDGEIIGQVRVAVYEDDDAETLAVRVLRKEHWLYPRAIKLFAKKVMSDTAGHTTGHGR